MKTFAIIALLIAATSARKADFALPAFNYEDLINGLNGVSGKPEVIEKFAETAKDIGAFLIKDFPGRSEYTSALENLRNEAAECFGTENPEKVVSLKVSPSVIRSTSAVGSSDPLSDHPLCIRQSADVIKHTMNRIGSVVHQLIDKITSSRSNYKLPGDEVVPISSSPNLDHIHLYTSTEDQEDPTAALHTDNGLFLLATPTSESPLLVLDSNGATLTTLTDEPAIVVLFGRGLDQWLLHPEDRNKFRAAPHFVPALKSGKQRVIFARMYVAPKEAVPTHGDRMEFGKFFMGVEDKTLSTSNLCPSMKTIHRTSPVTSSASALLWRSARSLMCDEGSSFCWMGCLPIDSTCPASQQSCYNSEQQPCCVEGQTSADGCLDMDISCQWHCN